MALRAARLFAILACGLLWPCATKRDDDEVQQIRVASSQLVVEKKASKAKAYRWVPQQVESMIDGMSAVAKDAFPAEKVRDAFHMMSSLYDGYGAEHDKADLRQDLARETHKLPDDSSVNGKLSPHGFLNLLSFASKNNPNLASDHDGKVKAGHFYDLGASTGRHVILASLVGFEGDGFVAGQSHYRFACKRLHRLAPHPDGNVNRNGDSAMCGSDGAGHAKFTQASLEDPVVDFSDADVTFADTSGYSDDDMKLLAQKASKMKAGSVIVSSRDIPDPGELFESLQENMRLPTDNGQQWHFHRVKE